MIRLHSQSLWILFVVFCFVVHSFDARADEYPKKINFQNIMQNQDIALGEVESIVQDHEGFMWLGGRNALLRFDGNEFLSVRIADDVNDFTNTSPVNQVVELLQDSRHTLWVATRSGLFIYDRDREILVRFESSADSPHALPHVTINALAEAPNGDILAGFDDGVAVIDPSTRKTYQLAHRDDDPNSLPSNVIHDIYVDHLGMVWLGLYEGVARIAWATKKMTLFVPEPKNLKSPAGGGVGTIAMDLNDDVWFGTGEGIYRLTPASGAIVHYQNNPDDRFSLADNISRQVFVDKKGWVWTGSDQGGISLYDKINDRFIRYQVDEGRIGSLSSNTIRRIYEDKGGDMWIGTYPSGVNFYDRSTSAISVIKKEVDLERGLLDNNVEAIEEDKNGAIWIGAGGVTRYDPKKETFTHYQSTRGKDSKISTRSVMNGVIDSDDEIRFGSWAHGVELYNAEQDRFDEVPADPTLVHNGFKSSDKLNDQMIWSVYEDKNKTLWMATHFNGLTRYDKRTHRYHFYSPAANDPTAISNQLVWVTFEDSKGRFWVGTANGLNLMDRDKETFKHYVPKADDHRSLANGSVLCIFEDRKKRLWFGTDAGLHLYHDDTDNFTRFNTKDGFVDNGIRTIIEDPSGNLWMGTNNGIVMFNADTHLVRNYMRYNGEKIGGVATGAGLATARGEMMFGTKNGLYIFDTNKLRANQLIPPVVFTDFRLFTKKVLVNGPDALLPKVINQTDQIVLDYKKSMISLSFAALNYRDAEKNQFAYKLEGFDDGWREVGNQRTALYTNLDAGTYHFKVRASNNDGIWNEDGKSITIIQLPPPWKTWWAYSLYFLMILAIIVVFVNSQRKKRQLVEEQNRLLEMKVLERTAELREKNKDIQAMLSNMRQGLFTLEEGGTIHHEYSHFLEDIFETNTIAGVNALSLLFAKATLGADTFDRVKVAVNAILGEDPLNFDFNAHLLIEEYQAHFEQGPKYLSLDWNPIINEGVVTKLMVSVRDVSLLKQMESDAKIKKRELDIISQLISVPAKKYLSFVASTQRFIAENRAQILASPERSDPVIALLFRNMHTIKGNCRTFGFSFLSDVVHDVESHYSAIKTDSSVPWNSDYLIDDLHRVETCLNEYDYVYCNVLGRSDATSARDQQGFWADAKAIETIQRCIQDVSQQLQPYPSLTNARLLKPIESLLNVALSNSLSDLLADVVNSLPSIAVQLNKEAPQVFIEDKGVRVKWNASELITNSFAHILRNAIDHGIEAPDVRLAKAKPSCGTIHLRAQIEDKVLVIRVKDDGQGINITRLFQKGVDSGRWLATDTPSHENIANLIFESGVSTKETLTDISGRGVGMDAVKQFVQAQGGDIGLHLMEQHLVDGALMVAFELVIRLPESMFVAVE